MTLDRFTDDADVAQTMAPTPISSTSSPSMPVAPTTMGPRWCTACSSPLAPAAV
jgi:hypothetical protein